MSRTDIDVTKLNEAVREEALQVQAAVDEVRKVIVGQAALVDRLMIGLLCRRPRPARGRARPGQDPGRQDARRRRSTCSSPASSSRPTCCPPTSSARSIYQPRRRASSWPRKGPIFANLVLADEINRAPAKVQSALLEAMQERQVTIGDATYPLPEPVPRARHPEPDRAGGHLPAARGAGRPLHAQGRWSTTRRRPRSAQILDRMVVRRRARRSAACSAATRSARWRRACARSTSTSASRDYIVALVAATREPGRRRPRRPRATSSPTAPRRAPPSPSRRPRGRTPSCAAAATSPPRTSRRSRPDVLRHRVLLTYEAEAEDVTSRTRSSTRILDAVEVP